MKIDINLLKLHINEGIKASRCSAVRTSNSVPRAFNEGVAVGLETALDFIEGFTEEEN